MSIYFQMSIIDMDSQVLLGPCKVMKWDYGIKMMAYSPCPSLKVKSSIFLRLH
jgi:hypothetical protein